MYTLIIVCLYIAKVLFAFWGAEELGLFGSRHYVSQLGTGSNPQKSDIALNLNFDMVVSQCLHQSHSPNVLISNALHLVLKYSSSSVLHIYYVIHGEIIIQILVNIIIIIIGLELPSFSVIQCIK